jgi:Family of unknown function (DUF5683)
MNKVLPLLLLTIFLTLYHIGRCQTDTTSSYLRGNREPAVRTDSLPAKRKGRHKGQSDSPYALDSLSKRHNPGKASFYSAVCPGLGQIYNHKYWKLPLVYAAVGIPVYTYIYNRSWYEKCQYALTVLNNYTDSGAAVPPAALAKVNPQLQPFLTGTGDDNDLRNYRNEFRQNEDYSILFFLLFWGLQIVDATVDAHLKYFDVSDQLTMQLQTPSENMLPAHATGVSMAFEWHKARHKLLLAP